MSRQAGNMAKVSISEAARLVGVSRSNLYKSYIKQGKLSISTNHLGKPEVDTSELLRVFGSLQQCTGTVDSGGQQVTASVDRSRQAVTPLVDNSDTFILTENQQLKEQLQAAQIRLELMEGQLNKADEQAEWYKRQIEDLVGTVKLLEHQKQGQEGRRRWWQWFKN